MTGRPPLDNAKGYFRVGEVDGRMTAEAYERDVNEGLYGFVVADRYEVIAKGRPMDKVKAAARSVDVRRLEQFARN